MDNNFSGIIIKGVGGFYYVEAAEKIYECKARGIFRKLNMTPVAGDRVNISINEEDTDKTAVINEVLQRKNVLIRPPVANLDQLIIVVSICDPAPNTLIIDNLIAIAEYKNIEPIIVITKCDLANTDEIYNIYNKTGFTTIIASSITGQGINEIKNIMSGKISAFTGNSGVGKSSLLNLINPDLNLETNDISKKLGRGRHTTRQVELYKINNGGYIADTPGFSSLDLEKCEIIHKDELQFTFREFAPFINKCKFTSCAHVKEKGCRIRQEVEKGNIQKTRYDSYVEMYNKVKDIKDWEK